MHEFAGSGHTVAELRALHRFGLGQSDGEDSFHDGILSVMMHCGDQLLKSMTASAFAHVTAFEHR
jgi:hypothetical protein